MGKFTIQYTASEDDIKKLLLMDSDVFDKKDNINIDSLIDWLKINDEIYTILKFDNEPVGYINFTAITEECYRKFKIGENKDYNLTIKDIMPFKKGKNLCLFTSIVVKKEFRDGKAIKILWKAFRNKLKQLEKHGKYIENVIVDCVSIDGIKLTLNNLHGKYICNSSDWGKIYEGNVSNKRRKFPKIKLKELNKKNLKTIAKIQYEIFKDSKSVGYCDYLEELKNDGKVGDDFAKSYLIIYKNKPVGIIGLIQYANYPEDIFLNWFGVLPKYRDKGIGTNALLKIVKMARNYNVKSFRLYSYVLWHKVAQNIYRKTMQLEEAYTNEKDSLMLEKMGQTLVYSISLVDKVASKWNNKYLNLSSEIQLNERSVNQLHKDKII